MAVAIPDTAEFARRVLPLLGPPTFKAFVQQLLTLGFRAVHEPEQVGETLPYPSPNPNPNPNSSPDPNPTHQPQPQT